MSKERKDKENTARNGKTQIPSGEDTQQEESKTTTRTRGWKPK